MARVNLLCWNIEVYGPKKYAGTPNTMLVTRFVTRTIMEAQANLVVLIELSGSVAGQICKSLAEDLYVLSGDNKLRWRYATIPAMAGGGGEHYGYLWRQSGTGFGEINVGRDQIYLQLSEQGFPNNLGQLFGRRAAMMGFRATDTGNTFTVSVYHAPPPNSWGQTYARAGVEALAKSNDLYHLSLGGDMGIVAGRMLAGDYNLNVNDGPSFTWLTDPARPNNQPPAQAGQGAGTRPITTKRTHLLSLQQVEGRWGQSIEGWGTDPGDYKELPIDNVFYRGANPAGDVIDLMQHVMIPGTSQRGLAEQFKLWNLMNPAFPNANLLRTPLSETLSDARCAWLFLRHAISDHYPVHAAIDI